MLPADGADARTGGGIIPIDNSSAAIASRAPANSIELEDDLFLLLCSGRSFNPPDFHPYLRALFAFLVLSMICSSGLKLVISDK